MIGIINYGLCNILSVKRAFYLYTDDVVIINSADDIKKADKLVLPGVGSFKDGMKALSNSSMSSAIHNAVSQGKLILGICLGMQMFFDGSYEGGKSYGFGFIKGWVEKIPVYSYFGEMQNVPHIGWNFLFPGQNRNFKDTIFENVPQNGEVYFVHSFEGKAINEKDILAYTEYGGRRICAAVNKDNIWGCQFHPEKSGKVGLGIIEKFIKI